MLRTRIIVALLVTLLAGIGAAEFSRDAEAARQAGSYCSGVSDSLRASGWAPAGCR
jgi:hypothetical protein